MPEFSAADLDFAGALVGFLLTVFIFSYVFGDNPLYRLAAHFFVGAAAGYVASVVTLNVIVPQLLLPLETVADPNQALDAAQLWLLGGGVPLTLLLLLKIVNPASMVGRFPVAFMVGVGTAVALGGALTGTLLPQTLAATFPLQGDNLEQLLSDGVILIGTIATLLMFYYGARHLPGGRTERSLPIRWMAYVGQTFLGVTFGVMYAGALAASLSFLAERLTFIWNFIAPWIGV